MPTYDYRCRDCGHSLEVRQSFSDDPLTTCPACGGELRKVFSPVGISFKGSGFYKTDSRGGAATSTSSAAESSTETTTSTSTADAGSTTNGSGGSDSSSGSGSDAGSGSGSTPSNPSSASSSAGTSSPAA